MIGDADVCGVQQEQRAESAVTITVAAESNSR